MPVEGSVRREGERSIQLSVSRGSQADILDDGRTEVGIIIHLELVVIEDGVEGYGDNGPLEGGGVIGGQGIGSREGEQWDGWSIGTGEGTDLRPITGTIGAIGLDAPVESGAGSQVGGRGVGSRERSGREDCAGGAAFLFLANDNSEVGIGADLDGVAGGVGDTLPGEGGLEGEFVMSIGWRSELRRSECGAEGEGGGPGTGFAEGIEGTHVPVEGGVRREGERGIQLSVSRGSQADILDDGRAETGIIIHLELVVIEDGVEGYRDNGPLEGGGVIGGQGIGSREGENRNARCVR